MNKITEKDAVELVAGLFKYCPPLNKNTTQGEIIKAWKKAELIVLVDCYNCEHCLKHGHDGMFCDEMLERDLEKRELEHKWKRIENKTVIQDWCPLKKTELYT